VIQVARAARWLGKMQLERPNRKPAFMGLTPLIDMIFLLLLFFLLGSDFIRFTQSQLAPPRGSGGDDGMSQVVIIALAANGNVQWNGATLTHDGLSRKAGDAVARDAEQLFVVMPEGKAAVQTIVSLLDQLQSAGAKQVTLEQDIFDIDLSDF
jgi:biopolymer transport protein ExbD